MGPCQADAHREGGVMADLETDRILEQLRRVSYPGFSRDIVAQGFVRRIEVDEGVTA